VAYGSAAAVVVAGIACAIAVPPLAGQLLTIVLLSLGLGGAVLLLFFEVGLSEDRERALDQERREESERRAAERALHEQERARREQERAGREAERKRERPPSSRPGGPRHSAPGRWRPRRRPE
jgi:hypothetical protein